MIKYVMKLVAITLLFLLISENVNSALDVNCREVSQFITSNERMYDLQYQVDNFNLLNNCKKINNPILLELLGKYYILGIGTANNAELGTEFIIQSAYLGNSNAKKLFVLLHFDWEYKYKNSLYTEWSKELIENKDSDIIAISILDKFNIGSIDYESANKELGELDAKAPYVNFALGAINIEEGKLKEAIPYIKKAAKLGVIEANYMYGMYLRTIKSDIDEANYYLKRAASNGHDEALLIVGKDLFSDKGTNKNNIETAKSYLKSSVENGNFHAANVLAKIYIYQNGYANNLEAEKYLLIAARAGLRASKYNLALLYKDNYHENIEPRVSLSKAIYWASQAKVNGYEKANDLILWLENRLLTLPKDTH